MNTTHLIDKESLLEFFTSETFQEYTRNLIEEYDDKENCIVDFAEDIIKAIMNVIKTEEVIEINGDTSDGYHTFNELYHHRAMLFSVIVKAFPDKAWKSKQHNDGTMYDGMFIVGIDTPEGQATYHYNIDPYWDMFKCRELSRAPEWDGHTPAQAIERIGSLNPIRYGKWIWDNDAIDWNIGDWVCSECGGGNENIHTGKPGTVEGFGTNPYIWAGSRFCPSCGAKMEPIFP